MESKDMISVVVTLILTALILLVGGVGVQVLLASLVAMCGSYLVGTKLKSLEEKYKDWKYWTLIVLEFITTILLVCGLTYRSYWTLVAGGVSAVVAVIVKVIAHTIENKSK